MSWEDVLKRTTTGPGFPLYPKTEEDKDRMAEMIFGESKKPSQPRRREGMRDEQRKLADDILSEIEKEGGALGMKNLKQFASEKRLKEVLSMLEDAGKIFMHKDGDIYTHEPTK